MERILASIACGFASLALAQQPPAVSCPAGADWLPWRLAAVENAETPIFASAGNTRSAPLCNCTAAPETADPGVWVLTQERETKQMGRVHGGPKTSGMKANGDLPPPPKPGPGLDVYYLAGGACVVVGPGSVFLRTADHRAVKWGVWKP